MEKGRKLIDHFLDGKRKSKTKQMFSKRQRRQPGLPDFSRYNIPKREKYTK
jgi:hypothetical protein